MPSLPTPGASIGNWGTALNAYLQVGHDSAGHHENVIDVDEYGADPSGVADSTTALQAALNAVPTGGGIVRLKGKYLISATLNPKNGTTIEGVGWLAYNGSSSSLIYAPSITTPVIERTDASEEIKIRSLEIYANGASSTCIGVHAANATRWTIEDCNIWNCGGPAIKVDAGVANTYRHLLLHGLVVRTGWASPTGVIHNLATDCHLDFVESTAGTNNDSLTTTGNITAILVGGFNFMTSCVGEFAQLGYVFQGAGGDPEGACMVLECRADFNNGEGFRVASTHNQFVGCYGIGNSQTGDNTADGWVITSWSNVFIGCRDYHHFGGLSTRYGFNDSTSDPSKTYDASNKYIHCRKDSADSGPGGTADFNFSGTLQKAWTPTAQSGLQTVSANGQTINTAGIAVARTTTTAARTGIILQAGTYAGQEVTVINETVTASATLTMAVSGTSNVADGTSDVIAITSARKFIWDSGTSLWYRAS